MTTIPDPTADGWDPAQYERFGSERAQPFFDLLALVRPLAGGRAVDLGCGTGELTARLHDAVGAGTTVGIDSSDAMLARALPLTRPGLRFERGDVAALSSPDSYDLIFSNAALQWLPDHAQLFRRLAGALRPAGQLAVQMPANADHPAHSTAAAVAEEPPFFAAMDGHPPPDTVLGVLAPERYAELLDQLGFTEQRVRLEVYGHHLASTEAVAEWTKGTTLTRFRRVLTPPVYEQFVDRYRRRVRERLGEQAPYFYTFKRILLWAARP